MGSKVLIMRLALATLVGMPLIAILIDRNSETVSLADALIGYSPWWKQVLAGTALGVAGALGAQFVISRPFMEKVNVRYATLVFNFQFGWAEILLISLCAGVGEEILFRGAIQPYFGIWITSVLFVAIHGYLNPRDWRLSIYGLFMTGVIYIMGWMAQYYGLVSAIIAHTLIDVYLLHRMQESNESVSPEPTEAETSSDNPSEL